MARKNITSSIESELIKCLKHLAVDTDKALNDLLEEAIRDLLKKYKKLENISVK
jgi:predicted transcriptional regulator